VLQLVDYRDDDGGGGILVQPLLLCCAQADELEWGAPGADERVRRLANLKPDMLLAADCCYIDQDGESPSTPHFIQACKGNSGAGVGSLHPGGGEGAESFC
jgi:hypothetical protein